MALTIPQRAFSVEEYLKSNGNIRLLLVNFSKKFPNAESENRRHVTRLVSKFRTHGTVCNCSYPNDRAIAAHVSAVLDLLLLEHFTTGVS